MRKVNYMCDEFNLYSNGFFDPKINLIFIDL